MMSENDRQKVFWLLKKYSSYTAWKALGDAYSAFADAWMVAMNTSDMRDSTEISWRSGHTKEIIDGKVAFNKGLPLLKKGDRQVFRRNSRGHLSEAMKPMLFVQKIMDPEEYVHDWMKNKDDVFLKYDLLTKSRCGQGVVLEKREGSSAPLEGWSALMTEHPTNGYPIWTEEAVATPTKLSTVPFPTDIVIASGEDAPIDGIYEPEWSASDISGSNWLDKLKSAAASDKALAIEKGCMNYLISGAKAPLYQDGEFDKPIPVIWRLIWKDERYLDGTIPEEESEYLKPVQESAPQNLRCEGGEPCPRDGYWWTPARPGAGRVFKQGEIMPKFQSDYGATIWQWSVNQTET